MAESWQRRCSCLWELGARMYGDTAAQMAAMFRDDIARARGITEHDWKRRPFFQRIKEICAPI